MRTEPDLVVVTRCCSWMRWRPAAADKGSGFPRRRVGGGWRWRCGRLVALSLVGVLSRGGRRRITEGQKRALKTRERQQGGSSFPQWVGMGVGGGGRVTFLHSA